MWNNTRQTDHRLNARNWESGWWIHFKRCFNFLRYLSGCFHWYSTPYKIVHWKKDDVICIVDKTFELVIVTKKILVSVSHMDAVRYSYVWIYTHRIVSVFTTNANIHAIIIYRKNKKKTRHNDNTYTKQVNFMLLLRSFIYLFLTYFACILLH